MTLLSRVGSELLQPTPGAMSSSSIDLCRNARRRGDTSFCPSEYRTPRQPACRAMVIVTEPPPPRGGALMSWSPRLVLPGRPPARLPPHIDLPHPQECRYVEGGWEGRGWPAVSHSLCDGRCTLRVGQRRRVVVGLGRICLLGRWVAAAECSLLQEAKAERAFRRE